MSGGKLVCPKPFVLYLSLKKLLKLVKTADLQAHNASRFDAFVLVDLLFSKWMVTDFNPFIWPSGNGPLVVEHYINALETSRVQESTRISMGKLKKTT